MVLALQEHNLVGLLKTQNLSMKYKDKLRGTKALYIFNTNR